MRLTSSRVVLAAVGAAALALSACSSSGSGTASNATAPKPPSIPVAQSIGPPEGQVNLIAWGGYVDKPWSDPFTAATSCKVNVKVAGTSDEMVALMKTGEYDAVSASGDASLRLIYGGLVAPVNTDFVSNYATVSPFLKNQPWNSVAGQMYGIPHGWGANVLAYRPDKVTPAPDSWGVVFDPASPYKGHITAYDSPIYIADAALYLKATKPDLKITNPYELDSKQFDAAVALLKQQHSVIGEYWSDFTKAAQALETGDTVLGTTWQVIANQVNTDPKAKVVTLVPKEGSTGWSDTWMIAAKAKHPSCAYKWMNWIISPKVNAQVAESYGEAPAQTLSCPLTQDPKFCGNYHAEDAAYAAKIAYWSTPVKSCGDSRGTACKDYSDWAKAWTAIRG